MQSLASFFEDNKPLAYAATVAAIIVLIAVVYLLYRLLFGRRLRTAVGGRARQPRLGIVDAFDLDRQRQLVLVRRDNVEHLIMIGGPTDVVIESAIVRTQAVPSAREKDSAGPVVATLPAAPNGNGSTLPATVPPIAATIPAPRTEPSLGTPSPAPIAVERGAPRPQPSIDPTVAPAAEIAPQPGRATAPLSRPMPQPPRSQATATLPPPTPPPTSGSSANAVAPPAGRPALPPRPLPRTPLPPRPSLASGLPPRPIRPLPSRAEPPSPGNTVAPPPAQSGPEGAPPMPGTAPQDVDAPTAANVGQKPATESEPRAAEASPRPARALETLESLEEEMAKLLGRPAPRRED